MAAAQSWRERQRRKAGRAPTLCSLPGSAVFTMMSFVFTPTNGDSGRVAAQIVTGIGFLGGGVILRETAGVTGTTTAASIWVTAAMGMVVGAGRAGAAVGLALVIRAALIILHGFEERWLAKLPPTDAALSFHPDHGKTQLRIEKILVEFEARYELEPLAGETTDLARMRLRFRLPHRHQRELLAELAALPQMHEIREA